METKKEFKEAGTAISIKPAIRYPKNYREIFIVFAIKI